ncbi:hypothetical protein GCM10010280_59110 [Streptomyces pilosus]|uniref:Uncharacterized protein n=1 Tax=Streptomyces pilosus TaxID=28893 RepID=A0A918C344_9ACTN|nr:hypothetical protein GCM10010280_59110 [Streptomyces pilosus]
MEPQGRNAPGVTTRRSSLTGRLPPSAVSSRSVPVMVSAKRAPRRAFMYGALPLRKVRVTCRVTQPQEKTAEVTMSRESVAQWLIH